MKTLYDRLKPEYQKDDYQNVDLKAKLRSIYITGHLTLIDIIALEQEFSIDLFDGFLLQKVNKLFNDYESN